jgi:hypothetical protein
MSPFTLGYLTLQKHPNELPKVAKLTKKTNLVTLAMEQLKSHAKHKSGRATRQSTERHFA